MIWSSDRKKSVLLEARGRDCSYVVLFIVYSINTIDATITQFDSMLVRIHQNVSISCLPIKWAS